MSCLTFQLQSGAFKESITIDGPEISLKELRERALKFIIDHFPNHGLGDQLSEHLLFYRHDLRSINILQLISTACEIAEGTLVEVVISSVPQCERILVHPHTLYVHSYKSPTFCDFCGEMLFGLVKQGLKCQGCGLNYHKRCASKIPNNCSGARQRRPSVIPLSPRSSLNLNFAGVPQSTPAAPMPSLGPRPSPSMSQFSHLMLTPDILVTSDEDSTAFGAGVKDESGMYLTPMPRKDRSSSWSGRPLWMEVEDAKRIKVPHTFQIHTYTRPTVCQHCKKLLKGLIRQGLQCRDCKYNCHKKCEEFVAKECAGNITQSPSFMLGAGLVSYNVIESGYAGSSSDTSSVCDLQLEQEGDEDALPRASTSEDSGGEVLSESCNIPLQRIVQSKKNTKRPASKVLKEGWMMHYTNKNPMKKRHYWRLDTKAITLYNDEVSSRYYKEIPLSDILNIRTASDVDKANLVRRPSHCFELKTASVTYYVGLGDNKQVDLAIQWEQAIKHAYMPVTPQSSTGSHATRETLRVPAPGEQGQLGREIQSEVDFSQLYQIFPEEVLGSGQFGTVYGGVQRKTGKHVAVKVIDKLKFPSKQEAALRTEVDILQKIKQPGIVEFEQMCETPERIFVVMEKMKGDMLEMILSSERGRLSERITTFLITQCNANREFLLDSFGAAYLHSMNIVHCDLKPENILLASDSDFPQVKLCDFGFARIIGERSFRRSVVGTPAYLAPEVLLNKGFNRSLDMCLSGTFPFNEDEDINDQIQNAAFMYPPNPWKEISDDAIEFINNLLQVKITKRFTVHKALAHVWLQNYQLWADLRRLEEKEVGQRYITHGTYYTATHLVFVERTPQGRNL